jgi:hypothetical protein
VRTGELVIICNTDKNWKFDMKYNIAIYLVQAKGNG